MEDAWPGKPVIREHRETGPGLTTLLAVSAEKPPPSCGYPVTELHERVAVGRHGVVPEVAGDHLLEPFSLLGNRLVHALSQFLFDRLELCPHAVAPGLPFDQEATPAGFAADEGEAQEVEGLRLCEPAAFAAVPALLGAFLYPGYGTIRKGYNFRPRTRKGCCALTVNAIGLH
jgi:hypothetical protein